MTTNKVKSVLDLLKENPESIKLSEKDMVKYNCCDHPDHLKGITGNGKAAIVYSLYRIDIKLNHGFAQNINAWGRYLNESVILSEIIPLD